MKGVINVKNKEKLTRNLIWGIISVQTILTGIFFIIQVLRIYFGADPLEQVFTREKVGAHLLEIIVLIILWIVVVVGGIICSFIFKLEDKNISKHSKIFKLNNMINLLNIDNINPNELELINNEKKKRKISLFIVSIISLVCALMAFLYLFNPNHFLTSGIPNEQVINMVANVFPWVGVAFISAIVAVIFEEISAKKSIEAVKVLLKKYKKPFEYKEETRKEKLSLLAIRSVVVLAAIILIIVGIVNDGPSGVFYKAAKICSECIGLG